MWGGGVKNGIIHSCRHLTPIKHSCTTLTLHESQVHNWLLQFSSKKPASVFLSPPSQLLSNLRLRTNSQTFIPVPSLSSDLKLSLLVSAAEEVPVSHVVVGGVSVTFTAAPFSSLVIVTGFVRSWYVDRKSCDFIQVSHDISENEVGVSPVRCCVAKHKKHMINWYTDYQPYVQAKSKATGSLRQILCALHKNLFIEVYF